MLYLLVFRERVKNFYQRYDAYLVPAIKFLFALISFQVINKEIGYDTRLESFPVVLGLSLLSAFAPSAIMVLFAGLLSVLHIYFISPILSIIMVLIIMILYLLFARYTPKHGYVLLAIPILYMMKIPYVVPILLGIISTPITIIPSACGVIIYYMFQVIKSGVNMQVNMTVEDILAVYKTVIDNLVGNRMMIMSVLIFSLIIIVTYFIRRMSFDHAFEIAIVSGGLTTILGFLISDLILNHSNQIVAMILGTIASGVIVYIIHFFHLTLDYSETTKVQFEDDVYYYYVKAVPKVTVTEPQRNVKHINVKKADPERGYRPQDAGLGEEEDDLLEETDDITFYQNNRADSKNDTMD